MLRALFIACLLGWPAAWAQPFQLVVDSTPFARISGTQLALAGGADEGRATVPLGFSFPYHGRQYTAVTVTANGLAFLEPDGCASCGYAANQPLAAATPKGVLAPFWDDLRLDAPGAGIFSAATTENGAQALTLEWRDANSWFATSQYRLSFQLTLTALGEIVFHHGPVTGQGIALSGSVGISSPGGTTGISGLSCAAASPYCGLAEFIPNRRVAFRAPAGVELSATGVELRALSSSGGTLSVSAEATFRNAGTAPAQAMSWALYLSSDAAFQPGTDTRLTPALVGPLAVPARGSASQVAGGTVVRPASGTWYVLAVADADGAFAELEEGDNAVAAARPLAAGMNLAVGSVEGPASSGPGETETVTVQVQNTGMDAPVQLVKLAVYLSTDGQWDAADVKVGETSILPVQLDDFPVDVAVQVPPSLLPGAYRFVARLDDAAAVAELDEADNVRASGPVALSQLDLAVREVVPTTPAAPFAPAPWLFLGEPQRVVVTVENRGGATAAGAALSLYFSENEQLNALPDQLLGTAPLTLLPGQSATVPFSVVLPAADKQGRPYAPGDYVLLAVATAAADANTSDNVRGTGFRPFSLPGPDLQVLALRGPPRAAAGEPFFVQLRLRNAGIRPITAAPWRYVLSGNAFATAADPVVPRQVGGTLVASDQVTLQPGEELLRTDALLLPTGVAPGVWRLGLLAEVSGDLSPADNAVAPWPLQVVERTLGLQVTQLPDAVKGLPYRYAMQASVPGPVAFSCAALPEGLSLQADGTLGGTPGAVGVFALPVTLAAGGVTVGSTAVVRVLPGSSALEVATPSLPVIPRLGRWTWGLSATGGVGPYRWALSSGALPEGISLTEDGRLAGTTEDLEGRWPVTVQVTDGLGTVARRALELRVVAEGALFIRSVTPPPAAVRVEYAADLVAERTGGGVLEGPLAWRKVTGELPPGLEMQEAGAALLVRGTPVQGGLFTATFEVEDGKGRRDQAAVTFQVVAPGGWLWAEFQPARPGGVALGALVGPDGAR
ncbi:MAG: hypothetical protein FJ086_13200, partial [Deltaproteobacteria bacterium]|nr:hypothetical protein [Deltaproteobacteria bacterium]